MFALRKELKFMIINQFYDSQFSIAFNTLNINVI